MLHPPEGLCRLAEAITFLGVAIVLLQARSPSSGEVGYTFPVLCFVGFLVQVERAWRAPWHSG